MSVVTDADCIAYIQACGMVVPTALLPLITVAHNAAERGLVNYLGYDVQAQTVQEFLPHGTGNMRGDGDESSAGFDLTPGGLVVSRGIGRTTRRDLVLTQLPVTSVTSVYENYAIIGGAMNFPPQTKLDPTVYYIDQPRTGAFCWSGILYRIAGSWSIMPRSIQINYQAGLTADQLLNLYPEFRLAVLTAAAVNMGKIIARGRVALTGQLVSSVSIEDFSASFSGAGGSSLGSADGTGLAGLDFPTEARMMVRNWRHPAFLV